MGKLLKDIEKIRYIPDMFVTLEEKFVKDQSKEAEKNKENKEIFEKAVSGTILLALEQVGN